MDEAEALADRIAVLSAVRTVAEGTPGTLGGRDRAASEISFSLPPGVTVEQLPLASAEVRRHGESDGAVLIASPHLMRTLNALSMS